MASAARLRPPRNRSFSPFNEQVLIAALLLLLREQLGGAAWFEVASPLPDSPAASIEHTAPAVLTEDTAPSVHPD